MEKAVPQFDGQRAVFKLFNRDSVGMGQSLIKMLPDTGGKGRVEYAQIQLEIKPQAAGIQIGRADQ